MNKRIPLLLSTIRLVWLASCLVFCVSTTPRSCGAELERRILVYTKNGKGYVHDNIAASTAALKKLGEENHFAVDVSDDPAVFTDDNLKKYQVIVFNNNNNEIFDTEEQKAALQHFMKAGGGFVGIHSASGAMRNWPWFWSVLGGKFVRHPKLQTFTVKVKDKAHFSTVHLPDSFEWTDEFYFVDNMPSDLRILLAGDLTTLNDPAKDKYPGDKFGKEFPLAWCHEVAGGRAWYTALGHKPEHYSDPRLIRHILGGILWTMESKKVKK